MDRKPTPTVLEMGQLHFSGNIVPHTWYQHLVKEKKHRAGNDQVGTFTYPYLEAIVILSDICYWYRPKEIRDEDTGHVLRYEKRFWGDMLQRSYSQYGDLLGLGKNQARAALKWLEKKGLVKLHLRTVPTKIGNLPNVLFIELIVSGLIKINTLPSEPTQPSVSVHPHTPGQATQTNTEGAILALPDGSIGDSWVVLWALPFGN